MLFGYPHPVPYLDYRWRLGLVGISVSLHSPSLPLCPFR